MTVHTYKFDVKMTCAGCSGAVTRALGKRKDDLGITNFDVNLEKEEAVVTATASYDEVYEVIKKTGKEIRGGKVIDEPETTSA